jgi:nucleotide-binding universal stress UspA family protein
MKNILVPCDFSKSAEEAFKFAIKIASQSDGEIHVLFVIDITSLGGSSALSHSYVFNAGFLKDVEKEAEQKYQIMWEKHAPMTMRIKFRHLLSSLTLEIGNYINANKIDLVVMGTHGAGNASFGSNTEKIVRTSPVPVIAIRTAPEDIRNIVLPVFVPNQTNAHFIQKVKDLQSFFHATLHLIYINTPLFFQSDPDLNNELKEFAEQAQFSDFTLNVRAHYSIEAGIAHFAKEINADMIAMGTHARKGLDHFLLGSGTAENMVNNLKMPLWTQCLT